eukprot:8984182-Pyramimonas_sp.AAC.1
MSASSLLQPPATAAAAAGAAVPPSACALNPTSASIPGLLLLPAATDPDPLGFPAVDIAAASASPA